MHKPVSSPAPAPAAAGQPAATRPLSWLPRPASLPGLRWEARLLLAVIAAGAVATVWLWWHDTAAFPRSDLGGWLTNAGRVTGLLDGYLLGIVLLLMSRLPWLENRVGVGPLAAWHAAAGRYVILLAVAHTLLIVWGYAASTSTSPGSQAASLLTHYPDVLAATVAVGLLLGVGTASARALRRRLRYETWFYLHLYAYLAAALAFAHVLATGADFTTHPLARVTWAMFYLAVTAAVAWYRLLTPVIAALRHRLRVTKVRREAPGVTTLVIGGRRLDTLHAEPGQFFRWRFLTRDGWWQAHPFSLSAAPTSSHMRITVKAAGDYTTTLQRIRPGVRIAAEGPYGALTAARRTRSGALLLAGGIGITPLRALLDALTATPGNVILLYRVNHESEAVFGKELERFRTQHGADIRLLAGPPGSAADILAAGRLAREIPDIIERDVFVTGPPGFTDAALRALSRARVPLRQIHLEQFAL